MYHPWEWPHTANTYKLHMRIWFQAGESLKCMHPAPLIYVNNKIINVSSVSNNNIFLKSDYKFKELICWSNYEYRTTVVWIKRKRVC